MGKRICGFTLIEMVVVVALVSLLCAILLPVFASVQGKSRQTVCLSNMRQIGVGISLYVQDYDGYYPYAVDPVVLIMRARWSQTFPQFGADMSRLKLLHQVLKPYVSSPEMFKCPADTGFAKPDYLPVAVDAYPSSFNKLGTSYFYRTEMASRKANDSSIEYPSQINLLNEIVGHWHGALVPMAGRYNTLFCDGHVSSLTLDELMQLWDRPLNSALPAPSTY